MDEKRMPLINEEPKHRKKSKGNGLPRSKHKHIYETVLLYRYYHHTDLKTGGDKVTERVTPTKVCSICGRVDYVDHDPSYYTFVPIKSLPVLCSEKVLTEKALSLPKWRLEDCYDKFAIKIEETQPI